MQDFFTFFKSRGGICPERPSKDAGQGPDRNLFEINKNVRMSYDMWGVSKDSQWREYICDMFICINGTGSRASVMVYL